MSTALFPTKKQSKGRSNDDISLLRGQTSLYPEFSSRVNTYPLAEPIIFHYFINVIEVYIYYWFGRSNSSRSKPAFRPKQR